MDDSVIRMLRGALYPHITDYTMEVKYESEDDDLEIIERVTDTMKLLLSNNDEKMEQPDQPMLPTISLFDPTFEEPRDTVIKAGPRQQLPEIPTPKLLQAPHNIPSLFPEANAVVYLLMSPETIQRNHTAVVLRGKYVHGPVELSIPIERLLGESQTIHQLAARKVTQDLEEGRGWVYDAKEDHGACLKDRDPSLFDDIVKRQAVRLGQQFQVANRRCSETSQQPSRHPPGVDLMTRPADDSRSTYDRHRSLFPAPQQKLSKVQWRSCSTIKKEPRNHTIVRTREKKQGHFIFHFPFSIFHFPFSMNSVPLVTDTISVALSESYSRKSFEEDWTGASSEKIVLRIIELQQIDGTWMSLPDLEPVLGFKVPQDVFNVQRDTNGQKMWITLIVLGFLEHTMAREADVWKHDVVKTKMWLINMEGQCVQEFE
ncbi:e489d203-f31d-477f-b944-6504e5360cc2 [Sclerotinia trifoliorum]|uniref:E489d203-f31d-477f-b944-6504e5360cc2 n=1 Tax=Sclerotinia trifoliorum TaxID=28548 RepID=A0A8H2W3L3_9HELO|nr:e489d203-f31d-477f-b944-6504e5360cc2 [Sclerotinia trifoliorum]